MIIRSLIAAGMAAGLMVSAANAVTITNTESAKAYFTYTPKSGKPHSYTLAANHHMSLACKDGGTFTLGKSTENCSAKTAQILIKGSKGKMELVLPPI
jgi:hypothetical protein